MAINEQTQMGRAKNAILSLLERRLSVPKIYFDAEWADAHIAVLAIDRDGVGDVHVVLMFARSAFADPLPDPDRTAKEIDALLDRLMSIPAQYKYIAAVDITEFGVLYPLEISEHIEDRSFSSDGLGRVGFLAVVAPRDQEPKASVVVKPERFRAVVGSLADEYIQHHTADWEIRA